MSLVSLTEFSPKRWLLTKHTDIQHTDQYEIIRRARALAEAPAGQQPKPPNG